MSRYRGRSARRFRVSPSPPYHAHHESSAHSVAARSHARIPACLHGGGRQNHVARSLRLVEGACGGGGRGGLCPLSCSASDGNATRSPSSVTRRKKERKKERRPPEKDKRKRNLPPATKRHHAAARPATRPPVARPSAPRPRSHPQRLRLRASSGRRMPWPASRQACHCAASQRTGTASQLRAAR